MCGSTDSKRDSTWQNDVVQNIFNADDIDLLFIFLPHQTYTIKGKSCIVGKMPKRLTVVLCCNADGSKILALLVIGAKNLVILKTLELFPQVTKLIKNPV